MLLIRDVFQCKPGKSRAAAEIFNRALPVIQKNQGVQSGRILVDFVADYWTVVLELTVSDLNAYGTAMQDEAARKEIQQAMQGYMDLVEHGHREIFTIFA